MPVGVVSVRRILRGRPRSVGAGRISLHATVCNGGNSLVRGGWVGPVVEEVVDTIFQIAYRIFTATFSGRFGLSATVSFAGCSARTKVVHEVVGGPGDRPRRAILSATICGLRPDLSCYVPSSLPDVFFGLRIGVGAGAGHIVVVCVRIGGIDPRAGVGCRELLGGGVRVASGDETVVVPRLACLLRVDPPEGVTVGRD